ncbi:hypothetical protein BGZ72_007267 [Mortierella alpina]|nr:hypothetical protein BGZ72_007267 [Mortierella alpina]
MSYQAPGSCVADVESDNPRQRSSSSYVFTNATACNENEKTDDGGMTCARQPCCVHQERQLATPKEFWGNNYDHEGAEWIQRFEEIARANNWRPKAKLDIVPIYLAKQSDRTWFRENQHEWANFDSFKLAFKARFETSAWEQRLVEEYRLNSLAEPRTEIRLSYYDQIMAKLPGPVIAIVFLLQIMIPVMTVTAIMYKLFEVMFRFIL